MYHCICSCIVTGNVIFLDCSGKSDVNLLQSFAVLAAVIFINIFVVCFQSCHLLTVRREHLEHCKRFVKTLLKCWIRMWFNSLLMS